MLKKRDHKKNKKTRIKAMETENMNPETGLPVEETEPIREEAQEAQPEPEKDELQTAKDQAEEYLNLAQRVQADFENYRRRTKATRAEAYEDGARDFIKQLLPVVDNLERAIAQESADESLMTGVKLVYKQFTEALEKRGVQVIDRPGEKFDPNLENAVLQGATDEGEPGTVCAVLQKGYKMGDQVIRHAMVKVVAE